MLKGINISKSFGKKKVLDNINIEINQGKAAIILGPSGCGKTTLLRSLSLLDYPDSGKLIIDDLEYTFPSRNNNIKLPYPRVTVVYQQLFLWPHLTNKENIILAVKGKDYHADFERLVEFLDMHDFINNYPNQSSLGQKQRIAIARALILRPKYILFDEITSSLDIVQIENIIEIINNLKKDNIGIFLITHNMDVANKVGDKKIYLKG
ncbi:ABC transporter related protein [Caldithrix abyssi DSM 13497]|uniref:Arginine transport ATP-binding protein ArtP n=1 Tax=Caldithrix abyssi DSM 13497 TaxID=880073 RepID=H1XVT4_CALAY|nr:ATP-binding cassette domain-containing protein [Caldithrix abyssi]EHO40661.1 ABC transporter related protein [Caldithrix abyssi DSM 13497]